jgi:hypothetical protein
MVLDPSHKSRLNWRAKEHFVGDTLFDRIARVVCDAGCLPRKELYEAWHVARRLKRRVRGGRVIDVAAGHGLLSYVCALLDRSQTAAIAVDICKPPSAELIREAITAQWPQLSVTYHECPFETLTLQPGDVLVSSHACGSLTDTILQQAIDHRLAVAVLPCCHNLKTCHTGPLTGWMDGPLAIDTMRAIHLEQAEYRVWTQEIPRDITPKNRLLLGIPHEQTA